jgi:hypothetical protein
MSSAILYLAIVAIWACVLIPRWLKRDSAHATATVVPGVTAFSETVTPDGFVAAGVADDLGDATATAALPGDADEAPRPLPAPLSAEESRRRMLAARRRLLGMLVVLESAAIALALLGLAAMWVIVPPTIMLAGYLLLLREAAHADVEHAQREAEAAAARAQALAARNGRGAQHPTPVEGTPHAGTIAATAAAATAAATTAAELAAKFAAAPVPADYEDEDEDSGRDFAPGLAGKYTTSNADPDLADEDQYTYEAPRLRAVGD